MEIITETGLKVIRERRCIFHPLDKQPDRGFGRCGMGLGEAYGNGRGGDSRRPVCG